MHKTADSENWGVSFLSVIESPLCIAQKAIDVDPGVRFSPDSMSVGESAMIVLLVSLSLLRDSRQTVLNTLTTVQVAHVPLEHVGVADRPGLRLATDMNNP